MSTPPAPKLIWIDVTRCILRAAYLTQLQFKSGHCSTRYMWQDTQNQFVHETKCGKANELLSQTARTILYFEMDAWSMANNLNAINKRVVFPTAPPLEGSPRRDGKTSGDFRMKDGMFSEKPLDQNSFCTQRDMGNAAFLYRRGVIGRD